MLLNEPDPETGVYMRFENTEVWGFKHALRGMRNPLESWAKSDSSFEENADIGENDMGLAHRLIAGGTEHRKFMRQIFVSVDITAPIYWWKEFDTYKVGTVANSTSTMHKLASQPITRECFEIDDLDEEIFAEYEIETIINICEKLRVKYLENKDKKYWKELVRWLPEGWNQTRTVTMNYENLRTIYFQRRAHKLNEWSGTDNAELTNFIAWVKSLPYAEELITYEN